MMQKSKSVFKKQCDDYFVLHHVEHHAVYMFHKDVETLWNYIENGMEVVDLHTLLVDRGYDMSYDEIKDFVSFFAQLGVIKLEGVTEDEGVILENNQYDSYIDYCCSKSVPTILHIELTNACNLKCIHCFHDQSSVWLNFENLVKLLRETKNSSFVRVTFTGGEIGLYPKWREAIEVAQECGLSVAILSNLTCFNAQDLDYIAGVKPMFVRTSLYGSRASIHDGITGIEGSFDKTLQNIRYLKEKGVKSLIACSVMKDNVNDVVLLNQKAKEWGMQIEFGYQILPSRNGTKNVSGLMITHKSYEYLIKEGILRKSSETSCTPGSYRIAIDSVGYIYSCDALRVPIGNIKVDSVFDAICSEEMKKIKNAVAKYSPEKCQSCVSVAECFKCPGLVWSYNPYVNECSPVHCLYTSIVCGKGAGRC